MINCIIVDDEPLARQLISSYIDQVPELSCVGSYPSAMEAFIVLHQQQVDVIFLDIEMPGITGVDFVSSLKAVPKVIFITAYADYAVRAFEIDAVDYLIKPVSFERFIKSVEKLLPTVMAKNAVPLSLTLSYIFIKVEKRLIKVELLEIIYIETLGDYLKVHTNQATLVTYMTLAKLESLLPAPRFIRIHRSSIINVAYIKFIEGNMVKMEGISLAIGQTYRDNLLKTLG